MLALLALLGSAAWGQTAAPPAATGASTDVKFFADIAVKLEKAEENARREAIDAARTYQQAAESRVRQQLAQQPEYKLAKEELATAQRVQVEARTLNDAQLIVASTSRVSQGAAKLKEIEDAAIARDMDVMAARSILARLDRTAAEPRMPETPVAGSPLPGGGTQLVSAGAGASGTATNAGASSPPVRRPVPTTIDIGQTRAELVAFLNQNRAHYRVIEFSVSRPAGWSGVEYTGTVQRNTDVRGSSQTNTQTNGGPTQSVSTNGTDSTNAKITESGSRTTHHVGSKVEYATIATLGSHTVVTGYHRNALGGTSADTEVQTYQTGTVQVLLVDDVISKVSATNNTGVR